MKIRLIQRTVSFTMAVVITLGLFGGIDHLAAREGASGSGPGPSLRREAES
ncbi:MAG: hypothetical protein IPL57_13180 [Rubrivivax sp.]|nr:hypothetical protein [Rubrivivax sp.]